MMDKNEIPLSQEGIEELARELDEIAEDPTLLEEAEELHKKISYLPPEVLLRRFDI